MAQSLFENRSLVTFQIGNEHICRPVAHFLFENRSMVDFQIGNEVGAILMKMKIFKKGNAFCVADFTYPMSLFENRSLVDFQIGNEHVITLSVHFLLEK